MIGKRFVGFAVVIEKRPMAVRAVRQSADLGARRRFALVENRLHGVEKSLDAILVRQRLNEIAPENAAGVLRGDVAHQFHRKARVVLDDAINFLNRLALGPEFDRAQLQSFHENVRRARRDPADVDPVHVDGEKADERLFRRPGKDRRVHHGVVQMLPLHGGVIAQHKVATVQTIFAVHRETVAHRHADRVGDKHRNTAGALRDQLAVGSGEAHGKIFVFVNIRAKRRARDVGVDLIGDRHQSVADHFEGDRVDGWSMFGF